jgi:hypothetical protein
LDTRGDAIFDTGKDDTTLTGLLNYTTTQSAIDAGVAGGAGTITASTDIAPPPGVAGDVIAKYVNTAGGEATTYSWGTSPLTLAINDVIYFGVWVYATQYVSIEFFRFVGSTQVVALTHPGDSTWRWLEATITSDSATSTPYFRIDNNTSGSTYYFTGLTIRKNPSRTTGLPFTPRYSPMLGRGSVLNTTTLVAREAAIKTLTGNVGIGTTNPNHKLHLVGTGTGSTPKIRFETLNNGNDQYTVDGTEIGGIQFGADDYSWLTQHMSSEIVGIHRNPNYSGAQGDLVFKTSGTQGSAPTERMRIRYDGNVGIGTTNPASKLHIDNGVLVVEDTPETNPTLLLPDGDGTGASLNEHLIGNTHIGVAQFVSEQGADKSTIAIINKDRNNNTVKNASIGFYNTDTAGTGKYAGRIGFWPVQADALHNEFRVYTTNTVTYGAGYDYPQQRFVINKDGNVGIGTVSPGTPLDIYKSTGGADTYALKIQTNDTATASAGALGPGIGFYTRWWSGGGVQIPHGAIHAIKTEANGTSGGGLAFRTGHDSGANMVTNMVIDGNGNVGIGTTNPVSKLTVYGPSGNTQLKIHRESDSGEVNLSLYGQHSGGSTDWQIYHSGATADLKFWRGSDRGYISYSASYTSLNFTGQHRTFIKDVPFMEAGDLEGLIVSADQNKYIKMSGGIAVGSNAITTNESLPLVSLSTKVNDKKCFGVISASEDPETRHEAYGNFVSISEKELGDTRVYINSVGEGAMWVTNINGPLESGDYITTSNVAGYGQRQESEFLANYTVAKITMDCDFAPATQPIQIIKKELGNVNYWVKTTVSDVSLEEYSNLAEENRTTELETYYTRDVEELVYTPYEEITEIVTVDDEYDDVSFVPSTTLEAYSNLAVEEQASYTVTYTKTSTIAQFDTVVYTKTATLEVSSQDEYDVVTFKPFTTLEAYSNLTTEEQNTYTVTYTKNVTSTVTSMYYDGLTEDEQAEYTPKYTKMVERTFEAHELTTEDKAASTEHTRTLYKKIERKESKTETEGYDLEVREELVNVLDAHGQLQWEDDPSSATEKAYKIRYLDASGTQTDEANAVHIAAFVGVTYHCG